jgi:hypothetical protein
MEYSITGAARRACLKANEVLEDVVRFSFKFGGNIGEKTAEVVSDGLSYIVSEDIAKHTGAFAAGVVVAAPTALALASGVAITGVASTGFAFAALSGISGYLNMAIGSAFKYKSDSAIAELDQALHSKTNADCLQHADNLIHTTKLKITPDELCNAHDHLNTKIDARKDLSEFHIAASSAFGNMGGILGLITTFVVSQMLLRQKFGSDANWATMGALIIVSSVQDENSPPTTLQALLQGNTDDLLSAITDN